MSTIYKESDKTTPIVFVLSAGSDPGESLTQFAKEMNIPNDKKKTIALGSG